MASSNDSSSTSTTPAVGPHDHFLLAGQSSCPHICNLKTLDTVLTTQAKTGTHRSGRGISDPHDILSTPMAVLGPGTRPYDLEVVNLLTGDRVGLCSGHTSATNNIGEVCLSSTSLYLCSIAFASGSDDGTVRLWDGEKLFELCRHTHPGGSHICSDVCYSPKSEMMFFGHNDGVVNAWRIEVAKDCAGHSLELGKLGNQICGVAVMEEHEQIYAANRYTHTVSVFHPHTPGYLVSEFQVGGAVAGLVDFLYHAPSYSLLIHDSQNIHIFDVRMLGGRKTSGGGDSGDSSATTTKTSQAKRKFEVGPSCDNCYTEITQIGEETFMTANVTKTLSKWTLEGKILQKKDFDFTLRTVSYPYRGSWVVEGMLSKEERVLEDERIEFLEHVEGMRAVIRMESGGTVSVAAPKGFVSVVCSDYLF